MQKQMLIEHLDRLRGKIGADANSIGVGRATMLMNDIDVIRNIAISMPDDEDETIMLSPRLIAALEVQGVKQGQGVPPTKEQVLAALGSVLGMPVFITDGDELPVDDEDFDT